MINFQYYPADINKCKPIGFVTLEQFLKAIKNPKPKNAQIFEDIKKAEQEKDFNTKAELKKQLYKFTPCVIVKDWRKYENIVSFTGLLVLDFDHLEIKEAIRLKQILFDKCCFIVACWLSPSKHGIKALVKIPICKSIDEFKAYFKAIEQQLGNIKGFDPTTKNCVQDLFMSYDPDLLQRNDATIWTEKYIEPPKPKPNILRSVFIENRTNDIVNIVVNNINQITTTGHYKLRSTAYSLGGYIGAGYIDKNDAIYLINECIERHSYLSQKKETYKKTALTMIEQGINNPLYINYERNNNN